MRSLPVEHMQKPFKSMNRFLIATALLFFIPLCAAFSAEGGGRRGELVNSRKQEGKSGYA